MFVIGECIVKIILNIVMTTMMICLLNLNITGLKLHEILGIAVFFLFLFHIILNFKWVKSITKNLFKNTINSKAKIMYAIDILLLVLVILTVLTGVLISKHIFTDIATSNITATSHRHHSLAYLLGITLIIHIGLHWPSIRNGIKIKKDSFVEKMVICGFLLVIGITLLYSDTIKKLIIPKKEIVAPYQYEIEYNESTQNHTIITSEENQEEVITGENSLTTEKNEDISIQNDVTPTPDIPTLEEYLSKLICTACGRHCLLTNPECGKGRREQQEEVQEYNQLYGVSETYGADSFHTRN